MMPRYPLYIPSKGRWDSRLTARALDAMRVPYQMVVEAGDYDAYAAVIDPSRLLILDPAYQQAYDPFWPVAAGDSLGSGPARNFIWDHAQARGAARHWIMDDNIQAFYRLNHNAKIKVLDGAFFAAMEDFCDRYENVAMAGPAYESFTVQRAKHPPFVLNTRIYSCNLIRTDLPFRWRGRYNEDTDLSLRMLKAGWCTIQFVAFLQNKLATQRLPGGNTDAFYAAEGTLPKSRMLVEMHPDVARLTWRFNRWHHYVDYRPFQRNRLRRRPDAPAATGPNEYGLRLAHDLHGRRAGQGSVR